MEYMSWVWLGAFILFVAIELISLGLTSIWFAIGALAACVAYLLGGNFVVQIITFAVVTVLVLVLIRPYALKYINNRTEKTNIDALTALSGLPEMSIMKRYRKERSSRWST